MKIQEILLGVAVIFVSVIALADDPAISDVIVQQRWPWSRSALSYSPDRVFHLVCRQETAIHGVILKVEL